MIYFMGRVVKHWHRLPGDVTVSIPGDNQNLTGHGSEQPAAAVPALSRGWTGCSPEVPSGLNYSVSFA